MVELGVKLIFSTKEGLIKSDLPVAQGQVIASRQFLSDIFLQGRLKIEYALFTHGIMDADEALFYYVKLA